MKYEINVFFRKEAPPTKAQPSWTHEATITLPEDTTLHEASLKMKEMQVLLAPNGGVERKLTLRRVEQTTYTYSQAELDACHVTGKWPSY